MSSLLHGEGNPTILTTKQEFYESLGGGGDTGYSVDFSVKMPSIQQVGRYARYCAIVNQVEIIIMQLL